MLYDNTTVKGSWIQVSNMTELSKQWNRTVNNVTMAMPHSGIVKAARDPRNDIKQPQDLSVSVHFESDTQPVPLARLTTCNPRVSENIISKPPSPRPWSTFYVQS